MPPAMKEEPKQATLCQLGVKVKKEISLLSQVQPSAPPSAPPTPQAPPSAPTSAPEATPAPKKPRRRNARGKDNDVDANAVAVNTDACVAMNIDDDTAVTSGGVAMNTVAGTAITSGGDAKRTVSGGADDSATIIDAKSLLSNPLTMNKFQYRPPIVIILVVLGASRGCHSVCVCVCLCASTSLPTHVCVSSVGAIVHLCAGCALLQRT